MHARPTHRRGTGFVSTLLASAALLAGSPAAATIVRFETVLGPVDVRLYDTATPQTVANFLSYVDASAYDGTFFHRGVPGFVVQGGGFTFEDSTGVEGILLNPPDPNPTVVNEPGISNLRGTIAMAKLGGDPNSATNQWFFSLADNSANLDFQNGGFTVFGRVVGDGMAVVDQIAALQRVNAGGAFSALPVIDWTPGNPVLDENLANVNTIRRLSVLPGDYDFDGDVDLDDYNVYAGSLGSTTDAAADGNGDGVVDAVDFAIWRESFTASAAAVPEPTSGGLLAFATVLFGRRGLRRAQNAGLG